MRIPPKDLVYVVNGENLDDPCGRTLHLGARSATQHPAGIAAPSEIKISYRCT